MTQVEKTLIKFGLSENEIQVYLSTLETPRLTPYQIHKATGIPRTTVYDTLLSLSLKKLIELDQSDGIKKQQTFVTAKNPTSLRQIIRDNKQSLNELEVDILDILPQLTGKYSNYDTNTDFSYYPGIEGFKKIYLDRTVTPELIWNPLVTTDVLGRKTQREAVDSISKAVIQDNIPTKNLIPLTAWTKHVLTIQYERNPNYIKRNMKYIENSAFNIHTYISLTRNRVAIACSKDDEAWGIIIKSKALYATLKASFEVLWSIGTPVTKSFVESMGENELHKAIKKKGQKGL